MGITFKNAVKTSTFADLFTDSNTRATWYRLWTGSADGEVGNYVDTSAFNDLGDGWIKKDHLSFLKADFAQADDTDLWVQTWSAPQGKSSWIHGFINFNDIQGVTVTTSISGDTPLDQLFTNANVGLGTWYRIWIEDTDGSGKGKYLDTPYGKGWIKPAEEGGGLGSVRFPAPDPGQSKVIWIRTWTSTQQYSDWEHWTITTEDIPGPDNDDGDDTPTGTPDPVAETGTEETETAETIENSSTQTSGADLHWTDTDAGSYVDVSAADIITGESIDQFELTTGSSRIIKIDTQVTDASPLGTLDSLSCFTGNYDAQTDLFISAEAENAQDILVVYDTDVTVGQAQYNMVVLTRSAIESNSSWIQGVINFNDIDGVTVITGDTPLDQLFPNDNADPGTWYRIWIEDTDGSGNGKYLDTPYGNGWIKPAEEGGGLSSVIFPAADPGQSKIIWIRTWTSTQQYSDWERWTITTEDVPGPDNADVDDTPAGIADPVPETNTEETNTEETSTEETSTEETSTEETSTEETSTEETSTEETSTEETMEENITQASDTVQHWIDTDTASYAEIFPADIITGESIDELELTTGLNQVIETDTMVTDDSPLGTLDSLSYFTGNYDEQTNAFISAGDENAQDILAVYDTDDTAGQAQYDMIVLTGVSDLADENMDGIFTVI